MQDFSILQLLRTLAAAGGNGGETAEEEKEGAADGKKGTSPTPHDPKEETRQSENAPTHARKNGESAKEAADEEGAAFAYENFLSRHDRAVERIRRRRTDKDGPDA